MRQYTARAEKIQSLVPFEPLDLGYDMYATCTAIIKKVTGEDLEHILVSVEQVLTYHLKNHHKPSGSGHLAKHFGIAIILVCN